MNCAYKANFPAFSAALASLAAWAAATSAAAAREAAAAAVVGAWLLGGLFLLLLEVFVMEEEGEEDGRVSRTVKTLGFVADWARMDFESQKMQALRTRVGDMDRWVASSWTVRVTGSESVVVSSESDWKA